MSPLTLKPLEWEDCTENMGERSHCCETVIGRYWVSQSGNAFRTTFITLRNDHRFEDIVADGVSLAVGKAKALEHYRDQLSLAFIGGSTIKLPKGQSVAEVEAKPVTGPVAFLYITSYGTKSASTKRRDVPAGSVVIPLTTEVSGEVKAWRWADGAGSNADWRYSFVDPREYEEEVYEQGAESVISCTELYAIE